MEQGHFPTDGFADVLGANKEYVAQFKYSELTGRAAQGLAIVGMKAGDAKILRNAGARVTEDVLRTLVLATYLLGVNRILVMPHTDCRMASATEEEIHAHIEKEYGVNTRSLEFRTVKDQEAALAIDVERVRSYPLLRDGVIVGGAIYEVKTGTITPIDC